MAKIFTIDNDTKNYVRDAYDDFFDTFKKQCKLIYPAKFTECPNCNWDSFNKTSSGKYKVGGPVPFSMGQCPYCNGRGKIENVTSENVYFLCVWEPKKFFYPLPDFDLRMPFDYVQTKGYIADWAKVKKCDSMIFQIPIEGYGTKTYKLYHDPGDINSFIQERTFVCTWQKA